MLVNMHSIGLFNIDDTKDADTDEFAYQSNGDTTIGKDKLDTIKNLDVDKDKAKEVLESFGYSKSTEIKVKDFAKVFKALKELKNEA